MSRNALGHTKLSLGSVIGVIDVIGGRAVAPPPRGGGNRKQYRKVSQFAADPRRIADAMIDAGVAGIYLADLDAIGGGPCGLDSDWTRDLASRCETWIDAGRALGSAGRWCQILASESFEDLAVAQQFDRPTRSAIGLDYRGGRFIGRGEKAWRQWAIRSSLPAVVIDVASVGGDEPTTLSICRSLRRDGFGGRLISGGGVRNDRDIDRFLNAGVDRVLVGRRLMIDLDRV